MPTSRSLVQSASMLLATVALLIGAAASAQGAVKKGVLAGSVSKAPAGTLFEPTVVAYQLTPSLVATRVPVSAAGRFRTSVAPGLYALVLDGWVKGKPKSVVRLAVVKGGKTVRVAGLKAIAAPPPLRLSIGQFRVTDPSLAYLKNAMADLAISDFPFDRMAKCKMGLYEDRKYGRFGDILNEIKLGKSRFADPEFRAMALQAEKNIKLHAPTHRVNAVIDTLGDTSAAGTFSLVNLKTGKVEWQQRIEHAGPGAWADLGKVAMEALVSRLCDAGPFEVTLSAKTDATFATHAASGSLNATVRTTKSAQDEYRGSVTTQYENVTFVSKTDCTYVDPLITSMNFETTVTVTPNDTLKVTWSAGSGINTSASVLCPGDPQPPPIPGQVGPQLITPTPTTFELPLVGGVQAVGGGFQSGGDGWIHTGTITVKKVTTQ